MTWHQNVSMKFKVFIKKVLEKKGPSIIVSSYNHKLRYLQTDRSSRPEVFCEKIVLKDFTKFTGKHLCQRLFFNKVAGLRPATLLEKRLWRRCFPVNSAKFLKTHFL